MVYINVLNVCGPYDYVSVLWPMKDVIYLLGYKTTLNVRKLANN